MRRAYLLAWAAAAWPALAYANIGAGYLMLAIPALVVWVVPIVVVEAPILARALRVRFLRGLTLSTAANLATTIAGTLTAAVVDAILIAVTGSSGLPGGRADQIGALVPMFFISWWMEAYVVRDMQKGVPGAGRATLLANLVSYPLLAAAVFALAPVHSPADLRDRVYRSLPLLEREQEVLADHVKAHGSLPPATRIDAPARGIRWLVREADGSIVATLAHEGIPELDGRKVVMKPAIAEGRVREWTCRSPDIDVRYLPRGCSIEVKR